jgi:anti-anti-sigma factor
MMEFSRTEIGMMTYLTPSGLFADKPGLEALRETVKSCIQEHQFHLVLDLADVSTLNGMMVDALLDIQDELVRLGGSLKLVNASQVIREICQFTGLNNYVNLVE